MLFCLGGHFLPQVNQKVRYDHFSDYKKKLFWYFYHQYESTIKREPAASVYFSEVPWCTVLRVMCDLADIANEPIGDDCWEAGAKLSKFNG